MTPLQTRAALVSFGKRFRGVRLSAKMTQRELARRSRVGYRFISEMELGRENPSLATIVLLADGLGCELADLFPRQ
ncbi:MAG TPA: helix-turn-helix transcriptional regulator [Pyrinomonadaceae bacterium]|nr:helix-turn-helix transcriptional regulator [Pyrinomonadaceae bacterium]